MKQTIILDKDNFQKFDRYVVKNQDDLNWTYSVELLHSKYKVTLLNEGTVSLYEIVKQMS
jgi:hypothetical protein|tara:strand:- start:3818 stop:3997 length:180 start_codon:yes stop_codon:yes gene_type:complete